MFCDRCRNDWEERPGVSHGILKPEEAVGVVERALELCPEIAVVGIAGPGDPLASDHAFETFRLVHARFPELICCMSTNGLLLEQNAWRFLSVGVSSVTVTVNAVDPVILNRLNAGILWNGHWVSSVDGMKFFIDSQIAGIREAASLGMMVKINIVLVPGINDEHVESVAKTVSKAGARMINVLPLIPQNRLSDVPAPNCEQMNKARKDAEQYLSVFRHCRHCRADACGIPGGKDFGSELYGRKMETFSHG